MVCFFPLLARICRMLCSMLLAVAWTHMHEHVSVSISDNDVNKMYSQSNRNLLNNCGDIPWLQEWISNIVLLEGNTWHAHVHILACHPITVI